MPLHPSARGANARSLAKVTAIACKLNGAEGAYRGPAGNTLVFMTYGNVQLSK